MSLTRPPGTMRPWATATVSMCPNHDHAAARQKREQMSTAAVRPSGGGRRVEHLERRWQELALLARALYRDTAPLLRERRPPYRERPPHRTDTTGPLSAYSLCIPWSRA